MENPYTYGKFGEFPPYDRFAATDAIACYMADPTQENLNRAVIENIRIAAWFTYKIIDKRRVAYLTDDEIYSICCSSLAKAVRRFDPSRNAAFSTFATRVMVNSIVSANIKEQEHYRKFSAPSEMFDAEMIRKADGREPGSESLEIEEAVRTVDVWANENLSKRELTVYRDRQAGVPLHKTAAKLNVTRQGVRFIHGKIKRKLQEQFAFLKTAMEG
jgi:RNA polymerase sigma factor (sigma-70 family)